MLLLRSRKILAVIVLCIVFKNFKLQDAERVSVAPKKQNPTIDIVSIGSKTKYEFQRAQHATFGSHPFVRFFFNITEDDDVEQDCSTRLQWTDALQISDFCRGRRKDIKEKYNLLHNIKGWFQIPHKLRRRADKKGVAGWLCAQKRPMAGLWKAVQKYRETSQDGQLNLPDYLMIMDDDTYYNMNSVVEGLREHEQQEQLSVYELKPFVVAGCIIRFPPRPWQWSIPYGGWGTIFSKGALQAMLQPLNCSATVALRNATTTTTAGSLYRSPDKKTEYYSSILCPSIQNDLLGERKLFQDGMSLTDLMYRYVMHEPYTNYANWDVGFCLHSDWVWAYMVNYYNISIAMGRDSKEFVADRLGTYLGSKNMPERKNGPLNYSGQCDFNSNKACNKEAHMCHYVTPQHMEYLASTSNSTLIEVGL